MPKKVRTRFAPSPTGYLHVGSLRTALYSYLYAKQNKGDFLLRIEDTDQTREVEGAVENLLKTLDWAGVNPDEGVYLDSEGKISEKGNFGPYTQSKRLDIYQKFAQKLLKEGKAYYCFCKPERLEELRKNQEAQKQPTRYDRHCCNLSNQEVREKLEAGEKFVIRMKVPENQEIKFKDAVRGDVSINSNEVDDQIILKSDGFPTYHLAVVVDDHLMEITHVFRGEEWISSTPKHIILYQAFGWDIPEFVHISLTLNPDRTKLSKRQGAVAVEDFKEAGYLPETLNNFIVLLGWNPGTEQEIFSMEEMIKNFDLKKLNKSGAVFDREKLDWMNGEYIKQTDLDRFVELAKPFFEKNTNIKLEALGQTTIEKIFILEKQRISKLSEIGQGIGFLFQDKLDYDDKMLIWKKSDIESALNNLNILSEELNGYSETDWNAKILEEKIIAFIKNNNLTNGEILWPMRVALTGAEKSPTPFEVADILGKEKSIARIKEAINKLK